MMVNQQGEEPLERKYAEKRCGAPVVLLRLEFEIFIPGHPDFLPHTALES